MNKQNTAMPTSGHTPDQIIPPPLRRADGRGIGPDPPRVEIRACADQRTVSAAGSPLGIAVRLYGEDVRHLGRYRPVRPLTRGGCRVP